MTQSRLSPSTSFIGKYSGSPCSSTLCFPHHHFTCTVPPVLRSPVLNLVASEGAMYSVKLPAERESNAMAHATSSQSHPSPDTSNAFAHPSVSGPVFFTRSRSTSISIRTLTISLSSHRARNAVLGGLQTLPYVRYCRHSPQRCMRSTASAL